MIQSLGLGLLVGVIQLGIFFGSHQAAAEPLNISSMRALETACLKNTSEPRIKRWSGSCFCVADSIWREVRWEPKREAVQEIKWVESLLAETMTQAEFARDPYNLVETIDEILDQCGQPPKKSPARPQP